MKRRIFNIVPVFTLLLLCGCLSFDGANPYAKSTHTLSVKPQYPDEFPSELKGKTTLKISNRNQDISYTCAADENGCFNIELPSGSYRLSLSYRYDGKTLGGMTDKVIIGSEDVSAGLALNISLSGEIVFKEIYSGGCTKYPEKGNYQFDAYVIVHNNTDEVQYLDSLCFAASDPYRSIATNVWEDERDYIPAIQAVWQIGGDGRSFPLKPGEDAVIVVLGAIDHKATYPESVNLNNSSYFVCYNNSFFDNPKYHPAPGDRIRQDHILNVVIKLGEASAYAISIQSPALFIFKTPKGLTIQDYILQEGTVIQKPGSAKDRIVKVPNKWVLDGVEVFEKNGNNKKRLSSEIDASAVVFSGPFQGHTLFRKTDESASEMMGFEVLQDTNNSSEDMYEREKQSLNE